MLKTTAILRTIFFVFIAGFAFRAMPFFTSVARTLDEQYARCSDAVSLLTRAVWIAVGWIALETAGGWWMATHPPKEMPRTGSEPPLAPPQHG